MARYGYASGIDGSLLRFSLYNLAIITHRRYVDEMPAEYGKDL